MKVGAAMTGPRAALLLALAIAPAGAQNPRLAVTSVRFWSMGGSTRIAIETNGGFE
jgi:hypothetical protein